MQGTFGDLLMVHGHIDFMVAELQAAGHHGDGLYQLIPGYIELGDLPELGAEIYVTC